MGEGDRPENEMAMYSKGEESGLYQDGGEMDLHEGKEANNEIVRHIRTTSSVSRSGILYDKRRVERLEQALPYAKRLYLKVLSSQKDKGKELKINA